MRRVAKRQKLQHNSFEPIPTLPIYQPNPPANTPYSLSKSLYALLFKVTKQNLVKIISTLSHFVDIPKLCNIIESNSILVFQYVNKDTRDGFYDIVFKNKDNYVVMETSNYEMDCNCPKYVGYLFGEGKSNLCEHIMAIKILERVNSNKIIRVEATNLEYINHLRIKSYL